MFEHSHTVWVAAAALIDPASRVLLQRRPNGRHHGGLWEFPGGKVEPGEGPVSAVIREIGEELGLTIAAGDLFPISFAASPPGQDGEVVLMLFGCRVWQGEPVCEHGAMLAWVDLDTLASFPMPPLDVPLGNALRAMVKPAFKDLPRGRSALKARHS